MNTSPFIMEGEIFYEAPRECFEDALDILGCNKKEIINGFEYRLFGSKRLYALEQNGIYFLSEFAGKAGCKLYELRKELLA